MRSKATFFACGRQVVVLLGLQAAQPAAARGPGAELRFQAGGATSSGPAAGLGYEIILQAFNWESHREKWYQVCPEHRFVSCFAKLWAP